MVQTRLGGRGLQEVSIKLFSGDQDEHVGSSTGWHKNYTERNQKRNNRVCIDAGNSKIAICKICSKSLTRGWSFNRHMRLQHGIERKRKIKEDIRDEGKYEIKVFE